jgi:hypothetical protein
VALAQEMYAALFWQWHAAAVLRVQTWWRTIFFCRRGRAHMKTVRQALRRAFRVRVSDSKHFREKPLYRMKDIFGWNSQLKSDTRDEIALGSISVFGRQRARTYIWPNKEDWGHFVISRAEPRKGVPKEGFHVGTLEELCDQVWSCVCRAPEILICIHRREEADGGYLGVFTERPAPRCLPARSVCCNLSSQAAMSELRAMCTSCGWYQRTDCSCSWIVR